MKDKKWEVLEKESKATSNILTVEQIIHILLKNRNLKTKKEIDAFLHPDLASVTTKNVGILEKQLKKTLTRITQAIEEKQQIVIYGDYDVDGITGTAILWETLYALGAKVMPYIPHRKDEGYGLSEKGIEHVTQQIPNTKLIITVDNGIVAHTAVDFANKKNIDVIITDHHTLGADVPKALTIVHTTALCGAGVAYMLSEELIKLYASSKVKQNQEAQNDNLPSDHLALVALATIADLVPLTGANRILLQFGLPILRETTRPGLKALFAEANLDPHTIGVYEIGHIIAPRLNAMGRLESAMDSLRLICTKDRLKAKVLADTLGRINKERQTLTTSATLHAITYVQQNKNSKKKLLFVVHEDYEEGIIGLVAGRLVEEFYVPAIVVSKGEKISKASARSIHGFNIIEFIRSSSDLLLNAGGHPMAAGFTIETEKIALLKESLEKLAEKQIKEALLQRTLRIDCKIPLDVVSQELYIKLQTLSPFGMGNPEPTFVSTVVLQDIKTVGAEKKHLKLQLQHPHGNLEAIAFGMGDRIGSLKIGEKIDIVYTISENEWNGRISLQLKIKDIKTTKKS